MHIYFKYISAPPLSMTGSGEDAEMYRRKFLASSVAASSLGGSMSVNGFAGSW